MSWVLVGIMNLGRLSSCMGHAINRCDWLCCADPCRSWKLSWTGMYTLCVPYLSLLILRFWPCRVWQKRRVVITKDVIALAFEGKEDEVDRIPLEQVEFIKEFSDNMEGEASEEETAEDRLWYIMQIATIPGGYNAGRSYYLRSNSKFMFDNMITLVSKLTVQAKERADKSSYFWRLQKKVAVFYTHDIFQALVSLLIAGVSNLNGFHTH